MLESIEQQAFKDCIVFETITLPTCFESIGREAFFNCKALKQLLLPENVSSIGESAFISCVSLEKINIPSKVKTLSAHVFHQCIRLEMVLLLVVQVYLLLNLKIQQIGILQKIQITKVVKHLILLILLKMLVA